MAWTETTRKIYARKTFRDASEVLNGYQVPGPTGLKKSDGSHLGGRPCKVRPLAVHCGEENDDDYTCFEHPSWSSP